MDNTPTTSIWKTMDAQMWYFSDPEVGEKDALKLEFPAHVWTHPVVHVSLNRPYHTQRSDIGRPVPGQAIPVPISAEKFEDEFEVEQILGH